MNKGIFLENPKGYKDLSNQMLMINPDWVVINVSGKKRRIKGLESVIEELRDLEWKPEIYGYHWIHGFRNEPNLIRDDLDLDGYIAMISPTLSTIENDLLSNLLKCKSVMFSVLTSLNMVRIANVENLIQISDYFLPVFRWNDVSKGTLVRNFGERVVPVIDIQGASIDDLEEPYNLTSQIFDNIGWFSLDKIHKKSIIRYWIGGL